MKTIYGKVSCEYWSQSRDIVAEVEDGATEEEMKEAMFQAALEESGLEYWWEYWWTSVEQS